ncbi:hypothetical protein Pelo_9139 [Pelomyxa schiedti]|nr:hypothetical protein Pelo_9139 [Pelomyxa schiedti]
MASSSSSSSNTGNNAWGEHVAALEAEVEGLRRLLRAEQVKEAAAQDTGGVGKCRLCAMRELDSARMKSSLERMQAILGELGALGSRHNELVVDEHKASTSQQQEQKQRNQPQQQGDRAADEFPSAADFRAMIARYRNANVLLLWGHLEKTVPHQRMRWQRVNDVFISPERDFAAWLKRHKATLYTNDEFGQQIISEIAQGQKLSKEMEAFCIQIYKESKVMGKANQKGLVAELKKSKVPWDQKSSKLDTINSYIEARVTLWSHPHRFCNHSCYMHSS